MRIAFIGLGTMGYPMAGCLQQSNDDIVVYNRTLATAQRWAKDYCSDMAAETVYAQTPALASQDADMVFICVGNDDDVRQIVTGEQGVLSSLKAGGIIIDHTTTSDTLAQEMSQRTLEQGVTFLDAPVSGGQAGAENGQLAIMLGGEKTIAEKVRPVLQAYAASITYMGESGAGQATKMVNQVLIAGVLQGIAEGFALAKKANLHIPQVIKAIEQGAAGSWQLSNRGLNIDNDIFDYGFAVDWMVKDLGFCLNAAKEDGLHLPNTEHVQGSYKALQNKGFNRADTSVLVKQFKE